jgi:NAD(P)-dependent dehydrogenase (short-subunit alcohol dehydrogenase family)
LNVRITREGSANSGKPTAEKPEVVVITGASAGVGRATVRRFAEQGAHIALIARGRAGLEATKKEVEDVGGKALVLPVDVADAERVEQAAEQAERELGPIDIWINSAMVSMLAEFKDISPSEYKRITEVTYLGYVHGTMAALRRMMARDRGTIVQVGSALAYRGIPLQTAYCGAKHAIRGFTESLRCELLHDQSNIWITMVQLPAVNTPQFQWCGLKLDGQPQPVPPIYQPEVAADGIYFAAHQRRREVYVGGSTAIVIPGNKLAAGLGDRILAHTGYESQLFDGAPSPGRPDNLWRPLDEERDYGAHGIFDRRTHSRSLALWATKNRGWLSAAAAGCVAAVAAALVRRGMA